MRRALWPAVVTILALTCVGPADADSARAPVYALHWHRLARNAQVLTAGPLRLLAPQPGGPGTAPASGMLTDVRTGRRTAIHAPAGCAIADLSTTVVVDECGGGADPRILVDHLATGAVTSLDAPGFPVTVGTRWLQTGLPAPPGAPIDHEVTQYAFTNLLTGATVPDPSRIGAITFPDLDAADLSVVACPPVRLAGTRNGSSLNPVTPGTLVFVGQLAIHTHVLHTGRIGVQHCGSPTIHRYDAGPFADNARMLVWIGAGEGVLSGLRGDGNPFRIEFPERDFAGGPEMIAVDDDFVYLQGGGPVPAVWAARLPPSLRG